MDDIVLKLLMDLGCDLIFRPTPHRDLPGN